VDFILILYNLGLEIFGGELLHKTLLILICLILVVVINYVVF
jgi:hypothetical protein